MIFSFNRLVRCALKNYICSGNFLLLYGFTVKFPVTSVHLKCFLLYCTTNFSVKLAIWLPQMLNTCTGSTSISLIFKQIGLTLTISKDISTSHLQGHTTHAFRKLSWPNTADLPLKIFLSEVKSHTETWHRFTSSVEETEFCNMSTNSDKHKEQWAFKKSNQWQKLQFPWLALQFRDSLNYKRPGLCKSYLTTLLSYVFWWLCLFCFWFLRRTLSWTHSIHLQLYRKPN